MSEQVLGLSINQIMAYTAIANVLLVVVLAAVNIYYAGHAKRQADAAREQVDASNRQAETAAETLSLVRKQMEQQVRTDVAAVTLQLKVAIHVIEDWLKRIAPERHPQLPDQIAILPARFQPGHPAGPFDRSHRGGKYGRGRAVRHRSRDQSEDSADGRGWFPERKRGAGKGRQEPEYGQVQAVRGPHALGGRWPSRLDRREGGSA